MKIKIWWYIYIFVNLGITYTNLLPIRRFLCPLSTRDFVIFFFFCQGFPSRTLTTHKTGGEGRRLSFISLYRPRTFRHFFPTSHVRWLSHIFNRTACIYLMLHAIYHLIELPFDWFRMRCYFVCLLDDLILGFCYNNLTWETDGFELASTITLCITNKPTDQVC